MSKPLGHNSRQHLLRQLQQQLGCMERTVPRDGPVALSTGAPAIDRMLPSGGLRHGMLVEWLSARRGSGAATLSLLAAREACRAGGALVVIDRWQMFYPPAAVAWGVDPRRLIMVHPRSWRDELWATVQALRSPAAAAVWAAIDRLNNRAFRRLQLAAQAGRTLGVLVRPASAHHQPSWADVRLAVEGQLQNANWQPSAILNLQSAICNLQSLTRTPLFSTRRVRVHIARLRGGRPGGSVCLEIDDAAHAVRELDANNDTHPVPLVAELADPAAHSISARA